MATHSDNCDSPNKQELLPKSPKRTKILEARSLVFAPFPVQLSAAISSPMWCNVVNNKIGATMKQRDGIRKSMKKGETAVRASISFPPQVYETLEDIAREKKVSLAWVVREAAEKYIADKWPLFKGQV